MRGDPCDLTLTTIHDVGLEGPLAEDEHARRGRGRNRDNACRRGDWFQVARQGLHGRYSLRIGKPRGRKAYGDYSFRILEIFVANIQPAAIAFPPRDFLDSYLSGPFQFL